MVITVFIIAAFIFNDEKVEYSRPVSITTPISAVETPNTDFCQSAKAAVLIDAKSKAVLFAKNADARLPMASTTKIMTALCIIEKADPDSVITVTKEAADTEGSSIYLKTGEKITVSDLLYGLLLESGNDAAVALAVGVFGSEKSCVDYMNQRAHEMGLVCTKFENVHGLDSDNHYTTAYELSLVAAEAMNNSLFRKIAGTKTYTTKGENTRFFSNHNRLLASTEYAVGVKTGYTSKSGRCLVSAAKSDEREYIAVTLCDRNDWNDHKSMLTYAMDNFDIVQIASPESTVFRVGFENYVPYDNVYLTFEKNEEPVIGYRITVDFKNGRGNAEYYADGMSLGHFGIELQNIN